MLTGIVRAIRWLCRVMGTILALTGIVLLLMEWQATSAYHTLAKSCGPQGPIVEAEGAVPEAEGDGLGQPDWEALFAQSPDVCGWVCVEGTDISLPVMSSTSVPDGYYLSHDLWGKPSRTGVPFLDSRCSPAGSHCLVYGHHLATGGQFSALQRAYEQRVFDALGTCLWFTRDAGVTRFEPLCATVVDERFGPIQRFSFASDIELRTWLAAIRAQAQTTSIDADARIARTTRVMTLVTCASDLRGQPWRTLVVFAA